MDFPQPEEQLNQEPLDETQEPNLEQQQEDAISKALESLNITESLKEDELLKIGGMKAQ